MSRPPRTTGSTNRRIDPQRLEYSGKFNVRLPKSLHAALASEAEAEGVSLNQLIMTKLALHLQVR